MILAGFGLALTTLATAQNATWTQSGNEVVIDVYERTGDCAALRRGTAPPLRLQGRIGVPNGETFTIGNQLRCSMYVAGSGVLECRSGTVNISAAAGIYSGKFDVKLSNGRELKGEFSASMCSAPQL